MNGEMNGVLHRSHLCNELSRSKCKWNQNVHTLSSVIKCYTTFAQSSKPSCLIARLKHYSTYCMVYFRGSIRGDIFFFKISRIPVIVKSMVTWHLLLSKPTFLAKQQTSSTLVSYKMLVQKTVAVESQATWNAYKQNACLT